MEYSIADFEVKVHQTLDKDESQKYEKWPIKNL